MTIIKVISGDIEEGDWYLYFEENKFELRHFLSKPINLSELIASLEVQTEAKLKKIVAQAGWCFVDGIVDSLFNQKQFCFTCSLKDGRNFLGITDTYTYQKLDKITENNGDITNYAPTAEWFIALFGQQFGPYDLSTINNMITRNHINPHKCLSWKEGMLNWVAFMEVPELKALVQTPIKPPPLPKNYPSQPSSNPVGCIPLWQRFDFN